MVSAGAGQSRLLSGTVVSDRQLRGLEHKEDSTGWQKTQTGSSVALGLGSLNGMQVKKQIWRDKILSGEFRFPWCWDPGGP